MRSFILRKEDVERKWWLIDAEGKTLGRLATQIANLLTGKYKKTYTPHVDNGDFVVVINAEKVKLTGGKLDKKLYYKHTGYLGHLKVFTARRLLETHPERVIFLAVKGMLPKNKHRNHRLKRLKIYAGPEHPHTAQKPEPYKVEEGR